MTNAEAERADTEARNAVGQRGVLALAGCMSAVSLAVWWAEADVRTADPLVAGVGPAAVAVLVALAELCTVHVHFRRETHTVSFRVVALVIGLFALSPVGLLVAYTVGAGAVLAIRARLSLLKLTFNVAMLVLEVVVAVGVFSAIGASGHIHQPRTWLAAIVAALVIDFLGGLLVSLAIWLNQGELDPEGAAWLALSGALAATANASFALVAVILWSVAPEAVLLLAGVGATMFATYRAYGSLRRRHSELEVLREYTTALGQTLAFDAVAAAALEEARSRLEADRAELWFLPPGGDAIGTRIALDDSALTTDSRYPIPITDPLWGRLVSGVPAVVVTQNDRDAGSRALLGHYECKDLVAAPLRGARGLVGILLLRDRLGDVGTFEDADGRLLSALGQYTSIALENGRLVDALQGEAARREHEALHDQLTGLPNRRCLVERGAPLVRGAVFGAAPAVLLLGLDDFKEVNDTFGHSSGDGVLVEIANRLTEVVGRKGTIARLGGDEFALLLPDVASTQGAFRAGHLLRDAVSSPFVINGVPVHLDSTVGIALSPAHGSEVESLLRCADIARFQAKEQRTSIAVYDDEQDNHTPERLALAADLRATLADASFDLGYQPIVEMSTDQVIGVEVLARWEHPTRGFLPPPTYVAVAEQSDLIWLLTNYVLEHTLKQRQAWMSEGLDLRVSVNVSVHDLHREGFAADVARLLEATETPMGRLVLEVTETQALHHPERIAPVLSELRNSGVVVAIDDFGTGFSSLTSLRSLPLDEVKIDTSFVFNMTRNDHDNTIVRSIIELARRLKLDVVAEGVEDRETEKQLRELGCGSIQGYLLSPALSAPNLVAWIREVQATPSGSTAAPALRVAHT